MAKAAPIDGALAIKMGVPEGDGWQRPQRQQSGAAVRDRICGVLPGRDEVRGHPGRPQGSRDAAVTSTVGIGPRSEAGSGWMLTSGGAARPVPRAEAEALVEKAHQVCPYSNATRGNVDVKLSVV